MSADLTQRIDAAVGQQRKAGKTIRPVLALVCLLFFGCNSSVHEEKDPAHPRVLDRRLELTLFAEDPDIVTPIGIAVDRAGNVYVLESHTHTPPKDYAGPDTDRIRVFTDADGDGRPEKNSVFAEGLQEGVNIAFSPDEKLYVVTSRAVYAFSDIDGDLKADDKKEVLLLEEPEKVYAHAALLGITFSKDGWMYVSRGNTGSAFWSLRGTDGSMLSGYGDGGNVMRAKADGSNLEEVATGFWNPADIKFNAHGQLLAADNDPDSRGPNRLVHVVPGGDYGYKSLYGGSGIHPYLAWNGELPGKLPFVCPLGEAPSGLIDATHSSLPCDYRGAMLATIWEESRIVRVDLKPEGSSLKGEASVIIQGGEDFRPVALASGPQGEVYVTDWVLRRYPNHGKGRIWKISPLAAHERTVSDAAPTKRVTRDSTPNKDNILKGLASQDPFEHHSAVMTLCQSGREGLMVASATDKDLKVRLGGMLAMQLTGYAIPRSLMRKLLNDPKEVIRRQALIWIAEQSLTVYRSDVDDVLKYPDVSPGLFETYLETVRHLQSDFIDAYTNRKEAYAKSISRDLPPQFLTNFIRDENNPPAIRAMALKHVENADEQASLMRDALSRGQHPTLRAEAVRLLASVTRTGMTGPLLSLALNADEDPQLRADAIAALARQAGNFTAEVTRLLSDTEDVQLEAARYIRFKSPPLSEGDISKLSSHRVQQTRALKEQIGMISKNESKEVHRPASVDEWAEHVASGGDAARGRRVFYSPLGTCSSCHAVNATGGDLGPDLTKVALSKTRLQMLRAIIEPSSEISPEFQGWFIRLTNGDEIQGRQIDIGEETIELYTHTSGFKSFAKKDVSDYGMIETSLMPSGLEANLTISEVRDLLAFLETSAQAP